MSEIGNREYPPQWWEPGTTQVSYLRDHACLTILLSGEFDVYSCVAAYRQAHYILLGQVYDQVILDLTNVDFCDCAGLRSLIAMYYLATDRGATCVFQNPQSNLNWLLRELRPFPTSVVNSPGPPARR
jgi:anti-anti-sigma factor